MKTNIFKLLNLDAYVNNNQNDLFKFEEIND